MKDSIDYLNALVLGLLQGLSEFLPISSTAHLRLWGAFTEQSDPGAAYSAVIQLGSWFALLFYFRKDLHEIVSASFQALRQGNFQSSGARLALYITIGTLPICIAGLSFSDWVHGPLRSLEVLALGLIIVALWMCFAEYYAKHKIGLEGLGWQQALWIGLAQCLALIPGASRSGTTLAMALCLGLSRPAALRFSFLLSVPAIGLAGFYEFLTQFHELENAGLVGLGLGTLTASLSSYLCIAFLLYYVRNHSILIFAFYRIFLGVFVLLYFY